MKPGIGRAFSFWMVGALALVALMAPTQTAVAQGTGTVTASVRDCTGLAYQGPMTEVGSDCVAGSATFTFYLHGDGTDDSWNLSVGNSGEASMELKAGTYDVWTPGGSIFNVTVPENGTTSFVYGFPVAGSSEPAPPVPAPEPEPEMATLNVSTYACTGVVGAPIALIDIGPDCTPISTNVDFYLWGDETDDSWNLTTSTDGAVGINLQVGGYDIVDTTTWETVGTQLSSGGASLAIGYAAIPPVETGTLSVSTYSCTGVTGDAIVLNEIGPDCTLISTGLDFYLWGDGTDDSWFALTSAGGAVNVELPVGDYVVVDTSTWLQVDATVTADGSTLAIGLPASYGEANVASTP